MTKNRRAFAMADLVAVLATVVALGPPVVSSPSTPRRDRDMAQVGKLTQSLFNFANENNGLFPLPGTLDVAGQTVAAANPEHKNTTGNIMSLLIFQGYLSPEQLVSAAETNNSVAIDTDYQYHKPMAAEDPANALWDPAFAGTPIDLPPHSPGIANQSYAHLLPFGHRREQWRTTDSSLRAIISNRGPQFAQNDSGPSPATPGRWTLVPGPTGAGSNTLRFHGPSNRWEGHVGFNDGHVAYITEPYGAGLTFQRASGVLRTVPDNLFVNESDEASGDSGGTFIMNGRNAYMRPIANVTGSSIFLTAHVWRD